MVSVLEEQQTVGNFEVAREELVEIISNKTLPLANLAGVSFTVEGGADGVLSNRDASLVILIIENLVQNAIDETPAGKMVSLRLGWERGQFVFQVRDEGPGFPAAVKERLFAPCRSTKAGGSGIGLAISKQLANHLGAVLELQENAPTGCVFRLSMPSRKLAPERFADRAEMAQC